MSDDRVEDLHAAMQPFDLPFAVIDRRGEPYAVLDHRDVGVERWGPGDLHCVWWRLWLRENGGWRDAGVSGDQAESAYFYLHDRVLKTLRCCEHLEVEGFRFRLERDLPAGVGTPGRYGAVFRMWPGEDRKGDPVNEDELDAADPVLARLREICRVIVRDTHNQEEALLEELKRMR